jgi:hypothetical protein
MSGSQGGTRCCLHVRFRASMLPPAALSLRSRAISVELDNARTRVTHLVGCGSRGGQHRRHYKRMSSGQSVTNQKQHPCRQRASSKTSTCLWRNKLPTRACVCPHSSFLPFVRFAGFLGLEVRCKHFPVFLGACHAIRGVHVEQPVRLGHRASELAKGGISEKSNGFISPTHERTIRPGSDRQRDSRNDMITTELLYPGIYLRLLFGIR